MHEDLPERSPEVACLYLQLNTEWQRLKFTAQAGHEPEIEITDEETNETLAQLGYRLDSDRNTSPDPP